MSTKFLESVGSKLAERWVATLLTPAFVFWAGGAMVGLQRFGWAAISRWFGNQPEPLQVGLLVAGLCLVTASAFVVQRFDLPVLRFLEGYWGKWLRPVRRWLIAREAKRLEGVGERWQGLARLDPAQLTAEQRDAFVQLDWQQIHAPLPNQLMPTRLGNILRAAEQRSLEKYGLDALVCWSRLWLVLPEAVKKDLQEARAELDTAVRVWCWSVLFLVWGVWAWWAVLVGLVGVWFAYAWAMEAAMVYGELVEAAFDLYRHLLYQSLRWGLPEDPREERRVGEELTRYLWRGE